MASIHLTCISRDTGPFERDVNFGPIVVWLIIGIQLPSNETEEES